MSRLPSLVLTLVVLSCGVRITLPAGVTAQQPTPAAPGPEHEVLHALTGEWQVSSGGAAVGEATSRLLLEGRYLEVVLRLRAGPIQNAIYTFGFDRRHGHYTVVAMDNTGTYFVTALGEREGDDIPMYGKDDEPVMTALGLEKEFVIELQLRSDTDFAIETRFIDTRTQAREELPFITYELARVSR